MVKAIIFDIDGVLLDSFEANLLFWKLLMEKTGFEPPTREEFKPLFYMNFWNSIKVHTGLKADAEIKKIWELGHELIPYRTKFMKIPQHADKVIKSLSDSYLLGVVSGRVRKGIEEFFTITGLKSYFIISVGYEDTENHKPHPEPLLLASTKLGVEPNECVYIGDAPSDAIAAKDAGMKFVFFSNEPLEDVKFKTSDFKKLPDIISQLN